LTAERLADMSKNLSVELGLPVNAADLFKHIEQNAKYATRMVSRVPGEQQGKTVAICGAGWSLWDYVREHPRQYAHQVWACNSALPFLMDQGARVTHGFGIDQGEGMLEDWARTFDVKYMIASSVHPKLVAHLRSAHRRLLWFHNFLGLHDPEGWTAPDVCLWCHQRQDQHTDAWDPTNSRGMRWVTPPEKHDYQAVSYEMYLYKQFYRDTCQPGYSLNSVGRAIGIALYMGFSTIRVYGADCACAPDQPPMPSNESPHYPAWAKAATVYADGRTVHEVYGPKGMVLEGGGTDFGGRRWHTRSDMLITARHLVDMVNAWKPRIQLMGDTMPAAMLHWTPAQWLGGETGCHPTMKDGAVTGFRMHIEERRRLEALIAL